MNRGRGAGGASLGGVTLTHHTVHTLDCESFPRGGSQNLLNARFDHAWWVGGSQIGAESGRASRCTRAGGWVGGTLSFCTVPLYRYGIVSRSGARDLGHSGVTKRFLDIL